MSVRNDLSVHRIVKTEKGPNQMIPEHQHPFFHYIYFLNGHASVTVEKSSRLTKARTLVLIPPNTHHSILGVELACSIDVKFSCSLALQERLTALPYFLDSLGDYEDSLIRGIFEEAVSQREDFDEMISLRLYELLISILRSQTSTQGIWQERSYEELQTASTAPMERALRYIEAHIREPLHIADLAEMLNYNKNYFQAVFKESVGINPSTYIAQRKMAHAKNLMLYSDMNVTQISEYLGFQSIHYFSRLFKHMVGVPPTEYIHRTKQAVPINVVQNEYTPVGQFEIPLESKA